MSVPAEPGGTPEEPHGSTDPVEATDRDWRVRVQQAAREAAWASSRPRRSEEGFNYRWEHVQAVVRLARHLAELTGADAEVVEAAAWLHDVAKDTSNDHGRAGAREARRILAETDFALDKVEAVAEAIAKHVGLVVPAPVEPLEAAVVWDADKLTKVGATAILHYTGHRVMKGQGTTSDLLTWLPEPVLEDIVGCLHTAPAQAAGRRRLQVFRAFCEQAIDEFDGEDLLP